MNQLCAPGAEQRTDPARRNEVPVCAHGNRRGRDSGAAQALHHERAGRRDDERLVAPIAEAAHQEEQLALSTAPFRSGGDVQDSRRHERASCSQYCGKATRLPASRADR
jgi:hypothetical protein